MRPRARTESSLVVNSAQISVRRHVLTHANTPKIGSHPHARELDAILSDLHFLKRRNSAAPDEKPSVR